LNNLLNQHGGCYEARRTLSKFDIGGDPRYGALMTVNVSLTPHLEDFIHQTVNSGRYGSASEVVRAALRLLEHYEHQKAVSLEWLASEIQKGIASGPSEPITPAFWDGLRARIKDADAGNHD
jgi:antitoxin ParD1/3/4